MAHENYQALKHSKEKEESSKSRTQFVISVSTKIQEFLQNIFSSLEGISKNVKNEQSKEYLKHLNDASHSVFSSIKDMIDYIKIGNQKKSTLKR